MSLLALLVMAAAQTTNAVEPSSGAALPAAPCSVLRPYVVAVADNATDAERWAATELVQMLQQLVCPSGSSACNGPPLVNVTPSLQHSSGRPQIAVGPGAASLAGVPMAALQALPSNESFIIQTLGASSGAAVSVAISGRPVGTRGTYYGTTRFLEELGVVFLAADETVLPPCPPMLPVLNISFTPIFEYRDGDEPSLEFNLTYPLRQHYNGQSVFGSQLPRNDTQHGGYVHYAGGFVHTSYSILGGDGTRAAAEGPPLDLFHQHNAWFFPHDDPTVYGQLCWSNASLIDYVTQKVRETLRNNPTGSVVSVTVCACRDTAPGLPGI